MKTKDILVTSCVFFYLTSCSSPVNSMHEENRYENSSTFESLMFANQKRLGNKYHIKQIGFDSECIYSKEDLTSLVLRIVNQLAGFEIDKVTDGHDDTTNEYFTQITIAGKNFEFRTSSEGDYVDLDKIMPVLSTLTNQLAPTYDFNLTNPPYDQTAIIIYATKENLKRAVDEGYPCSLDSGRWFWRHNEWEWGLYSDITVARIPDFDELKINYHRTLKELYNQGYAVPDLSIDRIYITDMFNHHQIDISIDGEINTSSNEIIDTKVRCFWEGWGVVLAYTLVKHYDGIPSLYNKVNNITQRLAPEDYLARAEKAFGKRK